jgi:hypothetical protein
MFFVSVASKEFRFSVSPLFSTLTSKSTSVDSKRVIGSREIATRKLKMARRLRVKSEAGRAREKGVREVSGTSKIRVDELAGE